MSSERQTKDDAIEAPGNSGVIGGSFDRSDSKHNDGERTRRGRTSNASQSSDAQPQRNLIETRDLSVVFGRQVVLDRIQLTIPRGETVAVIGESGCGKTMLLKTLVGLLKPSRGEVLFDGININQINDIEMTKLRRRFGFVFQNAALFDSMTIAQNVAFPLRQHNVMKGSNERRFLLDRLAEVGLPDSVMMKRPAQLSGGMRKRVGLARALILEPDLVLYDEPTTGLDPIMSDVINELMMRTRQKYPVTSVIVTHDMRTARKVADRVIMLYPYARLAKGQPQIIYDGPPSGLDRCEDRRVRQFVEGEAGERLMEMRRDQSTGDLESLKQVHGR